MGYEYISYNEDLNGLSAKKSDKNEEVAAAVLRLSAENNIPQILFSPL